MESFERLFDPYERKARLYPALLALAPLFVLFVCRFGQKATLASGIVSLLIGCGCLFWLARIARNAGIAIQEKMWRTWGGSPSIRYLRHSDPIVDPNTRLRYHQVLSAGIGQTFPTSEEEHMDPVRADDLYRSGIRWLMEQTRDTKKYAHLFKENIAYGFHRNMLGLKPLALVIAVACAIFAYFWTGLLTLQAPYASIGGIGTWTFEQVIAVLFPSCIFFFWCLSVTRESVERTSAAYSERLFQACEGLRAPVKKRATAAAKQEKAA